MMSSLFLGLLVSMILGRISADCQNDIIQKCERVFSKKFRDYYTSGGKDLKEAQCSGVQAIIDCMSKDQTCRGDFIDESRFIILQTGIKNKKLICPNMIYEKLKQLTKGLNEKLNVPDIEPLPVTACYRDAFFDCSIKEAAKRFEKEHNMCRITEAVKTCYETKWNHCKSKIMEAYMNLLEKHLMKIVHTLENTNGRKLCFF